MMMRGQLSSVCILASFILVSSNASDSETESALINVAKVDGLKLNKVQDILTGPHYALEHLDHLSTVDRQELTRRAIAVEYIANTMLRELKDCGTGDYDKYDYEWKWDVNKKCLEAVQKYVFTDEESKEITEASKNEFIDGYGLDETMIFLPQAVEHIKDKYRAMYPTWSTRLSRALPFKRSKNKFQPVTVGSIVPVVDEVPVVVGSTRFSRALPFKRSKIQLERRAQEEEGDKGEAPPVEGTQIPIPVGVPVQPDDVQNAPIVQGNGQP